MTIIWTIKFFPTEDEKQSPFKYVFSLSDKKEQAQLFHRLETITKLEQIDWPGRWYHSIKGIKENILQISAGQSRLLFVLEGRDIIILHAFRKKSQKTKKRDIKRAQSNYERYLGEKDKRNG